MKKHALGQRYSYFSIVLRGTLLHVVDMVRVEGGTPSSRKCAAKFRSVWGCGPVSGTCDGGVLNLGMIAQTLSANEVHLWQFRSRGDRADRQM